MARISGNVNANGKIISNTSSNQRSFTVEHGDDFYLITFDRAYRETPSVLVNVINRDVESEINDINVGVYPSNESVRVEFWRNNNYDDLSFSFAAFGD